MQHLRYRQIRSVVVMLLIACGVCVAAALGAGERGQAHAQEEGGRAWVRLVHASPETTTADMYMDGASIFRGVGYGRATKYVEVAAGEHRVTAYPVATRSNRILDIQLTLDAGEHSTLVMIENPAGEPPVILLPLSDDAPPEADNQAGMARLRLLNVASASPAVDLLDADDGALASDVDYGASADSFVEPGARKLKLRGPDDRTVDAALDPFNFEPDQGYTLIAIDRGRDQQELRAVPLADGSDDETVTLAQVASRTPTRTPTPARTPAAGGANPSRPAATKTPAPARPSVKVSIDRGPNASYIINEFMEICATVNQRATVRLSYRSGNGSLVINEDVIVDRGCVWYSLTPRTTGTKSIRADMIIDGKVIVSASVRFRLIDYFQ